MWKVPTIAPTRFNLQEGGAYQTSPYWTQYPEDIGNRWRPASNQYDFMRNLVMPSLGLEGLGSLFGLGDSADVAKLTNLPEVQAYARMRMGQATALAPLDASKIAYKNNAISQYSQVISQIDNALANPPGGAWEPTEYANKVRDMKTLVSLGDDAYSKAIASAPAPSVRTPLPSNPVGVPASLNIPGLPGSGMSTATMALIGAGAVIVLGTLLKKKPRSNRGRRRR